MSKIKSAAEAAALIPDGAIVAVNSSSGLCCPDAVLAAIGERFRQEGAPRGLTMLHPIAAGDMFGTKGIDHLAQTGLISTIIGGSYPSGPSSAEPPLIWQMLGRNEVAAYNVPSGIMFDILREAAGNASRRADQGRTGNLRRSRSRRLRHERRRQAKADRQEGAVRGRGVALLPRRSSPMSRSSAPAPPTSAAI